MASTYLKPSYTRIAVFIFCFSIGYSSVKGQTPLAGASKESAAYRRAVYLAKKGQHLKAKKICYALLYHNPRDQKAEVLLGKLYSWDHAYDSASLYLGRAYEQNPSDLQTIESMVNLQIWSHHLDQALKYCDKGLALYGSSEQGLLLQKAKILARQGNTKASLLVVEQILAEHPSDAKALKLKVYLTKSLPEDRLNNAVGLSFSYDYFTNSYTPWKFGTLQYRHRSKGQGALLFTANLNYANRFNVQGLQGQISAYPQISLRLRGFVAAGYSNSLVYPQYYVAGGLFYKLGKHSRVEAAMHYLNFSLLGNALLLYGGGYTLGLGNSEVELKTYLSSLPNGLGQSYYLIGRHYFNSTYKSLSLTLNTGLSPHDYIDPITGKVYNYPSHNRRVKLAYQAPFLSRYLILKGSWGYENRKYETTTRERFSGSLGIEKLF
ncbi:MAG: hypothetical protein NVS1B13_00480 [Flavisolibacter sp.]